MQLYSVYNSYYVTLMQENYKCLVKLCDILKQDGYWDEPEKYLNNSIYDNLDLYVQSVLVQASIFCGRLSVTIRSLISQLTIQNILEIISDIEYPESIIMTSQHIINGPPIVLQLCSLYDFEKGTNMASVFLDHMMSILLAFAHIDGARDRTALTFVEQYYNKSIRFLNEEQAEICLGKRYLFKKISNEQISNCVEMQQLSNFIEKTSLDIKTEGKEQEDISQITRLELLLSQLNELIGLNDVKQQITSLINLIKVKKMREKYNMPTTDITYHMVFSGNPGTGKTTVARLLSQIYCELGLLSKGTLVETDRPGLVAGFVGQTALKVTEKVNSALGGVLFIDEAYSLTKQGSVNDYGSEAIDTLVKLMEDHRDDLVVIVAGYTEEMKEFLKSNTGLISRFNTFIEFPDYSTDELADILISMAVKADVRYKKSAIIQIKKYIDDMSEKERLEFGNARGIRNLFEKNLLSQANRIVTLKNPTKKLLSTIELEDVSNSLSLL